MIRAPSEGGPGRVVGCATLRKQRAQDEWAGWWAGWGQSYSRARGGGVTRCLRGASAGGRLRSERLGGALRTVRVRVTRKSEPLPCVRSAVRGQARGVVRKERIVTCSPRLLLPAPS